MFKHPKLVHALIWQVLKEVPNKNFFSPFFALGMWMNAIWELIRSLLMAFLYGVCFKETMLTIMLRIVGLVFPGVSAHMHVNYVSAVRLGPEILNQYTYKDHLVD